MDTYKAGDGVGADELNALARRVELLGMRARAAVASRRVVRSEGDGMRFGFELALRDGVVVWHRGYVMDGEMRPVAVGDEVWNELEWDGVQAFDVWLDVTVRGGAVGGSVSLARRDERAASGRLRCRLGFGEPVAGGGWRFVQVFGGLFNPFRPVMARGTVRRGTGIASGDGGTVRDTDWQAYGDPGRCAAGGVAQEDGYTIDPWGQKLRSDFFMYYLAGAFETAANEAQDGAGAVVRAVLLDNSVLHGRDY